MDTNNHIGITKSLVFDGKTLSIGELPSLQSLKFSEEYNQPLSVGVLPSLLQSLEFGDDFNQPISVGVLPSSLQSLTFGYDYNQPLSVGVLPLSLQSLKFGGGYNQPLSVGVLPLSLQSLVFGCCYDQPLSVGVLPTSLQALKFDNEYNQPLSVGVLPSSLQSLVFHWKFNQPLSPGVLPLSLQSLSFGDDFNQPISVGVLSTLLQSLKFGDAYNQAIPVGVLPFSLQSLVFGNGYNQPLSVRVLPTSLQSLKFGLGFNLPLSVEVLPSSIRSLTFGGRYDQPLSVGVLPSSLQLLEFGGRYNQPLSVGVLPSSLQSLKFGPMYAQPLSARVLPSSLLSLEFGDDFNQSLSVGILPTSLQSLKFGGRYDQPLSVGVLPSSLQSLKFGDRYNQPLSVGVLPLSLQLLEFGRDYNQPLSHGVLPPSLLSLVFGCCFNQPILVGVLPSSLQSLTLSRDYDQPLSIRVFPRSIRSVIFHWFLVKNPYLKKQQRPLTIQSDFKKSIKVGRYYLEIGPYQLLKLPSKKDSIIFTYTGSPSDIDITNCFNQPLPLLNVLSNPNSINYDPKYVVPYPFKKCNFVTVNNHKYFKLYSFPCTLNKVFLVISASSSELAVILNNYVNLKHYERVIWSYIDRLFLILEKLAQHNLAHLDIKPLNLFIGNNGEIVLGDFGCCRYVMERNQTLPTIIVENNPLTNPTNRIIKQESISVTPLTDLTRGTQGYYPPESKFKEYHSKSDAYSVGSTLLKLLSCHPDDASNRDEFVENHRNSKYNPDLVKISPIRYSLALIQFVKKLLTVTPQDRLSSDDLTVESLEPGTQIITSPFLVDKSKFLPNTTKLIFDGDYNCPLNGLLSPTLVKILLLGKFNQPIKQGDIPRLAETLIFGPSFNSEIEPRCLQNNSLKVVVFGRSFNHQISVGHGTYWSGGPFNKSRYFPSRPTINITTDIWNQEKESNIFSKNSKEEYKRINIYHTGRLNVHYIDTINSFTKVYLESKIILTIGEKCYGIGEIKREINLLSWKNNDIEFKMDLKDVSVISFVESSIYQHLFYQIEKKIFKEMNQVDLDGHVVDGYPLKDMEQLFELDNDNIHQIFQHNNQYLNIRFIPFPN
ncbi:hypothetical protein DFA_07116 [Cavenderia fasciculata]|uniref:Protein kinase domain-containing protein n=1 Tax=Cavenderia fasciculata TaxID=261658 RepID=F4PVI7_CACFS|nr:uncharacterized protein DFA_07116 [Cavenderia fasciculata]EGG20001.1 hypothetical protein DFA_07116 [Cavenderia fasciculata]|eukprot:XP_004366984.1 hypothetical protein DFA_07116 [Cavenderia fasciculata]